MKHASCCPLRLQPVLRCDAKRQGACGLQQKLATTARNYIYCICSAALHVCSVSMTRRAARSSACSSVNCSTLSSHGRKDWPAAGLDRWRRRRTDGALTVYGQQSARAVWCEASIQSLSAARSPAVRDESAVCSADCQCAAGEDVVHPPVRVCHLRHCTAHRRHMLPIAESAPARSPLHGARLVWCSTDVRLFGVSCAVAARPAPRRTPSPSPCTRPWASPAAPTPSAAPSPPLPSGPR